MASKTSEDVQTDAKPCSRRNFLKFAMALPCILAVGQVPTALKSIIDSASPSDATASSAQFPRVKVAQLSDLEVGKPMAFNYPLENERNVLVKLGVKAVGGIGADGDIVAFSSICQHLGCIYGFQTTGSSPACNSSYKADRPVGYCCCHGTVYDFTNAAKVISGPSPRPVPQVQLEMDNSGNIYAVGMGPPTIFGHDTGSNDVSADLQGGNPVGG